MLETILYYVACFSFVVGVFSGIKTWTKWYLNTSTIRIKPEMLQPIVNATFCAGTFVFYTVGSGFCSTLIGVSFPVSVPLLILYNKENQTATVNTENQIAPDNKENQIAIDNKDKQS